MTILDDLFPWRKLAQQHETMLMKLSQLDEVLVGLGTTLNKAKDEILAKITALENALRDVDMPDEAITALEGVINAARALDEVVLDPVPETPTE